jgi:hypothetical protein
VLKCNGMGIEVIERCGLRLRYQTYGD